MLDAFARWWAAERDVLRPVALVLLAICCAVFALGVPRLTIYGHDVFVSLDGGWRVLNGQRPGVDFFAQMGPAYYLLHAAGMSLAGGAASGLGYGTTLVAILLAAWSFFLLRGRMAGLPFVLACLSLVLLAVAPFPLGHTLRQTAFAMKHNRYAFALAGLVLLECFLPSSPNDSPRKQFGGGLSTGLACALLLFLKISYGLVALVLVALSILLRRREHLRLTGLLGGALLFALPMLVYLRFGLPALVREYSVLAAVQGQRISFLAIPYRVYLDRFEALPVLLLTLLTATLPALPSRRRVELFLVCFFVLAASALLSLTNTQPGGMPLLAVMALLLVNELTSALRSPDRSAVPTLLCFGLLAVSIPLTCDAAGLAAGLWDKAYPSKPAFCFKAPHLAALQFEDLKSPYTFNDNGQAFVRFTEEGMRLVQAQARPGESVRGMGMSNPFSYALLRPPPHGGAVNLSVTNVSRDAIASKQMLMGDVDLLLLPKYPASERETLALVLARYPELLSRDYALLAESPNWKLYRRRSD